MKKGNDFVDELEKGKKEARDEHFKKLIKNILESGKFSNRKIFKVDKLKNLYKQHLKGHVDHSEKIWKCINLELWFREFID